MIRMSVRKSLCTLLAFILTGFAVLSGCVLIRATHLHKVPYQDPDPMTDFRPPFSFTPTGARESIDVYHSVRQGPPVLLLHELPGLTQQCVSFARRLRDDGFTVYMPLLFGSPGRRISQLGGIAQCLKPKFSCLTDGPSRAAMGLVGLVDEIQRRDWDRDTPVGAIGMCLTGNFPLVLMKNHCVRAAVLSQPASPLPLLPGEGGRLGIDSGQIADVKSNQAPILVFRFTTDPVAPAERLDTLEATFGSQVDVHRLPADHPSHGVFTDNYRENFPQTAKAERYLFAYLHRQLDRGAPPSGNRCSPLPRTSAR